MKQYENESKANAWTASTAQRAHRDKQHATHARATVYANRRK